MTGGIAVFYQIAARLRELGLDVALTGAETAPGLKTQAGNGFAVMPWDAVSGRKGASFLRETDLLLIAEGWPNMMAPALAVKARTLVYAQNWAYVFSALPEGASWERLPAAFLAVSHPVARFVETMAKLPLAGIARPSIDTARFHPGSREGGKTVRVAWMPRKNKALAEQIMRITEALDTKGKPRIERVVIHNMPPDEVARTLGSCHIFLASGFPEGCPLPPLEAMASGCLVVGFSGFGGWDYMRQAEPGRYVPRVDLRPVPWNGNGLFASDGDVVEAAFLLGHAVAMVRENGPAYAAIREQALVTAAAYSADAQREEVRAVWSLLEAGS
ncbi:MAG: glycosyltransferase family 1 protein [Deltaproteobacteria bacterium]|nr:glycosyltransferase family 1 protein [Deltaproteobacteria bacterium]